MKKVVSLMMAVLLCLSLCACGGGGAAAELSVGDTYVKDGVSFTLNDFCFAKRTDGETYDPNMIDGAAWAPNDDYIFSYINYTINNGGKEAFSHFMDMDVSVEYGDGYSFGTEMTDYKVSCTEEDKYNLDLQPLMSKTYHHIITTCPESIAAGDADIRVVVELDGKKAAFVIPAAEVTVNEGKEAPKPEIPFTAADDAAAQFVIGCLTQNTYTWNDGNIACTLTFSKTEAQLTQRLAGSDYVSTGAYSVGTDKTKVNYGGDDVFYGWKQVGNGIELWLIES